MKRIGLPRFVRKNLDVPAGVNALEIEDDLDFRDLSSDAIVSLWNRLGGEEDKVLLQVTGKCSDARIYARLLSVCVDLTRISPWR